MTRLVAVAGNSCLAIRSLIVLLTICWLVEVRSTRLHSGEFKNCPKRPTHCASHSLSRKVQLMVISTEGSENGVGNCATQVRNSMVSTSNTLCICSLTGTGLLGETWRLQQWNFKTKALSDNAIVTYAVYHARNH